MKILSNSSIWNWNGRVGRLSYFVNYCLFLSTLNGLISGFIQLVFSDNIAVQLALIVANALVFLVILCNGMFKRIHDFGASALRVCLKWYGIPILLVLLGSVMMALSDDNLNPLYIAGALATLISALIVVVFPFYLMFRAGDAEANKYGEPEVEIRNLKAKIALSILFFIATLILAVANAAVLAQASFGSSNLVL